jgi:hypothetical protein
VVKRLHVAEALKAVRNGEPVDAFEAGKWLVEHDGRALAGRLMDIANDERCAMWNRVAALHTIGFLRRRPAVACGLVALLADQRQNIKIRGHAAESLAYYRETSAIPLLRQILLSSERPGLKVECVFALSKMWEMGDDLKTFNSSARKALDEFARTQPTGKAGRELRRALRAIRLGWT